MDGLVNYCCEFGYCSFALGLGGRLACRFDGSGFALGFCFRLYSVVAVVIVVFDWWFRWVMCKLDLCFCLLYGLFCDVFTMIVCYRLMRVVCILLCELCACRVLWLRFVVCALIWLLIVLFWLLLLYFGLES